MYSKTVTLNLGEGIECKVTVGCTPRTPESELQKMALRLLMARVDDLYMKNDK